jgi:hypothetical protein
VKIKKGNTFMGSLTPTLNASTIGTVLKAVETGVQYSRSRKDEKQALNQLRDRQNVQEQQTAQDVALEKQRIAETGTQAEDDRRRALKRSVARQRASFGSNGVSGGTGSSRAVLLGMFEESEDERQDREALDNLRSRTLDQNAEQQKSINVLQRTQLAERNRFDEQTRRFDIARGILK